MEPIFTIVLLIPCYLVKATTNFYCQLTKRFMRGSESLTQLTSFFISQVLLMFLLVAFMRLLEVNLKNLGKSLATIYTVLMWRSLESQFHLNFVQHLTNSKLQVKNSMQNRWELELLWQNLVRCQIVKKVQAKLQFSRTKWRNTLDHGHTGSLNILMISQLLHLQVQRNLFMTFMETCKKIKSKHCRGLMLMLYVGDQCNNYSKMAYIHWNLLQIETASTRIHKYS